MLENLSQLQVRPNEKLSPPPEIGYRQQELLIRDHDSLPPEKKKTGLPAKLNKQTSKPRLVMAT